MCLGEPPAQENGLSQIGYRSERKVEKLKNHARSYCLNIAISNIYVSKCFSLWITIVQVCFPSANCNSVSILFLCKLQFQLVYSHIVSL
jgi:hypothetical protein